MKINRWARGGPLYIFTRGNCRHQRAEGQGAFAPLFGREKKLTRG